MYQIIEKSYLEVYEDYVDDARKVFNLEENEYLSGENLVKLLNEYRSNELTAEIYEKIFTELTPDNAIKIDSIRDELYRINCYKPYVRHKGSDGHRYNRDYIVEFIKDYILKEIEN